MMGNILTISGIISYHQKSVAINHDRLSLSMSHSSAFSHSSSFLSFFSFSYVSLYLFCLRLCDLSLPSSHTSVVFACLSIIHESSLYGDFDVLVLILVCRSVIYPSSNHCFSFLLFLPTLSLFYLTHPITVSIPFYSSPLFPYLFTSSITLSFYSYPLSLLSFSLPGTPFLYFTSPNTPSISLSCFFFPLNVCALEI